MTHVVYVIECCLGKLYVGRCASDRLRTRLAEHRAGQGAAWTRRFPAVRIIYSRRSNDPLDEDRKVLELMRIHGVSNVRGGTYSQVELPRRQITSILEQLDHAAGRCIVCGDHGHYARECMADIQDGENECDETESSDESESDVCFRCGRKGHWIRYCVARTHVDGTTLGR